MTRFLVRIAEGLMIITVIYTGSFILMEETFEKTERAEGEGEAIFFQFNSSKSTKKDQKKLTDQTNYQPPSHRKIGFDSTSSVKSDFNIPFIYFSSYLDNHV